MHTPKLCRGAVLLMLALGLGAPAFAQPPAEPAAAPPAESSTESPAATPTAPTESETKTLAGISILGNQEAPKSLVIVPWKSSEIGSGIGVSRALDTSIRPVDKDVFMRELRYYEIRTGDGN
jgi:hypothetical protein